MDVSERENQEVLQTLWLKAALRRQDCLPAVKRHCVEGAWASKKALSKVKSFMYLSMIFCVSLSEYFVHQQSFVIACPGGSLVVAT